MPYLFITFSALLMGFAVAFLVAVTLQNPQVQAAGLRWQAWRQAQAQRLRGLGFKAGQGPLGWRPPLLGLGAGCLLAWLAQSGLFAVLGLGLGLAWPWLLERRLRTQRLERLSAQLPSLFEALSSALRSGQSLSQALASAVEDLPPPAAGLLDEALRRVRLGDGAEDALQGAGAMLEQSPLRADWRMLCTAVAVVRTSGGKLPEILDQLAATVRERQRLQAQVQAQTAQAKLSGWVIGCLPPALLLALQAIDPDLTAPLFQTAQGWAILAGAAVLELAGLFLLKRMAQVAV